MLTTLINLIDITQLPHQDLSWVFVVTAWHRDHSVIEDGLPDDAHLVPVQLADQVVVDDAGVNTSLDLQTTVECLPSWHGLHGHQEVEIETWDITGHHWQRGQTLPVNIKSLLV